MRYETIDTREDNLLPSAEASAAVSEAYMQAAEYAALADMMDTPIGERIRQGFEYTYRQAGHALTLVFVAHLGLAKEIDPEDLSIAALQPFVLRFLDAHTEWVDAGTPVGDESVHVEDAAYELVTAFMAILEHPEVVPECEPDRG